PSTSTTCWRTSPATPLCGCSTPRCKPPHQQPDPPPSDSLHHRGQNNPLAEAESDAPDSPSLCGDPLGMTQPASRSLTHPRDKISDTIDRIYRYKMTTPSGGNTSIRDGGDAWITPARVDKGSLTRTDVVCLKPDGSCEGRHRPSSEHPFHQAI